MTEDVDPGNDVRSLGATRSLGAPDSVLRSALFDTGGGNPVLAAEEVVKYP